MSVAACPSDTTQSVNLATARLLAPVRQQGGSLIRFTQRNGVTIASDIGEHGGYRVRLPRGEHGTEAALMNTGGGLVGGDRATHRVAAEAGTRTLVTTPTAERVYRTLGPATEVTVHLDVGPRARLAWMPQETILFQGAHLARRIEADVAADGVLLLLEMTVLGRGGMGERVTAASLREDWRIRRAGRLVFADAVRLDGDVAQTMQRPAVGGGARVIATLLYIAPDAADRLDHVRSLLTPHPVECGASAWNGLLSVRMLSDRIGEARAAIGPVLADLAHRPLPRMWWT